MGFAGLYVLTKFFSSALVPPLLFWMWLRWRMEDGLDPRPFAKFFIAGAALVAPLALVEHGLSAWLREDPVLLALLRRQEDPIGTALRTAWIAAAIPAEFSRAFLLGVAIYWRRGFARPKWIVAVSVALGMGMAGAESILRVYTQFDAFNRIQTVVLRALFSVPTFGAYSLAVGVSTAWWVSRNKDWRIGMTIGIVIAVIGHRFYDSSLMILMQHIRALDSELWIYAIIPVAAIAVSMAFLPVRAKYREVASLP
jgi:hypothetical protein